MSDLSLETLSIHGTCEIPSDQGTIPPVSMSSSFEYKTAEQLESVFSGQDYGHIYSRISNPSLTYYETKFNQIEGGIGAVSFSTGMSAVAASLLAFLKTGDHIIISNSLFGGCYDLFENIFNRWGIETSFIHIADKKEYLKAFKNNTKAVFLESIGNPKLDVPDIQQIADIAHEHEVPLIVDNTIATPILMQSQSFGADIAVYSTTKYCGEGQCLGGMVVDLGTFPFTDYPDKFPVLSRFFDQCGHWSYLYSLRQTALTILGMTLSPLSGYLQTVNLDTLPLRMEKHCKNALSLATFLETHPQVKKVRYPALKNHESYDLVQKQLRGQGAGVLTFELQSKKDCFFFINNRGWLKHLANIGDARTLLIHPSSTIYQRYSEQEKQSMGVSDQLIRVSVGLESSEDLITQFDKCLNQLGDN